MSKVITVSSRDYARLTETLCQFVESIGIDANDQDTFKKIEGIADGLMGHLLMSDVSEESHDQ